jgi:hypothetical protein
MYIEAICFSENSDQGDHKVLHGSLFVRNSLLSDGAVTAGRSSVAGKKIGHEFLMDLHASNSPEYERIIFGIFCLPP